MRPVVWHRKQPPAVGPPLLPLRPSATPTCRFTVDSSSLMPPCAWAHGKQGHALRMCAIDQVSASQGGPREVTWSMR